MKKMLLAVPFFLAYIGAFSQNEEMSLLTNRVEMNNKDGIYGYAEATTMTWAGHIECMNHVLDLHIGPILSKWSDDNVRLSIMPGVAHNFSNGQNFGSLMLLYKTVGSTECYLTAKAFRSFNKDPTARFTFDGEIMRDIGATKRFKLGLGIGAEQEKTKTVESGQEIMLYGDLFHAEARFLFRPKWSEKLSLTGFAGYRYVNEASKTIVLANNIDHQDKFVAGIGFELNLK